MAELRITQIPSTDETLAFKVELPEHSYDVTMPQAYYQKLTGGKITPKALVKKSFEFLLDREPASAILSEFDLPLISKYFPEYEEVISQ